MIDRLKSRLKNSEAKVLLENFLSLSALQIIGMVLPLVTLPYILRIIGFEKYGIIVFASSLIAYFQALTDYSFKVTAVRDVAIFKASPKKLNLIYSKVIIIKGIFLILALFLIGIIVLLYHPFFENRLIYGLSVLMLVGYALFPEWFFQGIEKMRYITYLHLGVKFFFTMCTFIFIRIEDDFWIYPLLQGSGFIVAGIIGQLLLIYKYKLKVIWLSRRIIRNTIIDNFPIFVNQFLPTLYNNTSVFLLGLIKGQFVVGLYQAISTIINLVITLIGILSRVFFPYLNRRKEDFPRYMKMMLGVVILLSIFILLSYKLVFWYLNVDYKYGFLLLFILTIGLIGYTFSNIFGLNYFIVYRQDKLVMNNTLQASLVGLVLAFPLIYYYGVIGAAANVTVARWLMGGGLWYRYIAFSRRFRR